MAGGFDGSIRIDTSIDEKGFNKSVNNLSLAFKTFGQSVGGVTGRIAKSIGTLIGSITGFGVVLIGVAAVAVLAIGGIVGIIASSLRSFFSLDKAAQDLKDSFSDLHNAFAIAFSPLVTFVTPYIQATINWLIKLFNTIAMITAAFLGQKEVLQAVAGGSEKAAKSTKKVADAAKGALAAFDEINVLQKQDNQSNLDVGTGINSAAFKTVPIDSEILGKVERIKKWFADTWERVYVGALLAWTSIKIIWGIASSWFQENVIIPVSKWFFQAWEDVKKWSSNAWLWIQDTWKNVGTWFQDNVITPLANIFVPMWNRIQILAHNAWAVITWLWGLLSEWIRTNVTEPIANWFFIAWENIKKWATNAWIWIVETWNKTSEWFGEHVGKPIREAFGTALDWVKGKWETIFTGIGNFVKGIINNIIDNLNTLLSGFGLVINGITNGMNTVGRKIPGWVEIPTQAVPQIPRLATGAVIPPNSQFAAILGDQRSGKNIEAPEGLIRQIIQEEMGGQQAQRVTIDFGNSSMSALIRTLNPIIKQENDRIGSSLIDGAGA